MRPSIGYVIQYPRNDNFVKSANSFLMQIAFVRIVSVYFFGSHNFASVRFCWWYDMAVVRLIRRCPRSFKRWRYWSLCISVFHETITMAPRSYGKKREWVSLQDEAAAANGVDWSCWEKAVSIYLYKLAKVSNYPRRMYNWRLKSKRYACSKDSHLASKESVLSAMKALPK